MTMCSPYPGYDVLSKWDSPSYNEQTREVLADRLAPPRKRRFFTDPEWLVLSALCERAIPQEREEPVPIAAVIDADVASGRGNGTRYADMPPTPDAWRRGLASLDAEALARHGSGFAAIAPSEQDAILRDAARDALTGPHWNLPPKRFVCDLALTSIVKIYYAHPAAMNEIGFGGPASPRGYVRLGANRFDGWEAPPGDWRGAP
jgi:hypothetical protein